MQTNRKIGRQE